MQKLQRLPNNWMRKVRHRSGGQQMLERLGLKPKQSRTNGTLIALGVLGASVLAGISIMLLVPGSSRTGGGGRKRFRFGLRRRDPAEFDRIETEGHQPPSEVVLNSVSK